MKKMILIIALALAASAATAQATTADRTIKYYHMPNTGNAVGIGGDSIATTNKFFEIWSAPWRAKYSGHVQYTYPGPTLRCMWNTEYGLHFVIAAYYDNNSYVGNAVCKAMNRPMVTNGWNRVK